MAPDASFLEVALTGFCAVAFAQFLAFAFRRTPEILAEDEPYEWMNKPKAPEPIPAPPEPSKPVTWEDFPPWFRPPAAPESLPRPFIDLLSSEYRRE